MSFGKIATIYALAICVLLSVTSVSAPLLLSAPEGRNMSPAGYEFFELIEGPLLDSSNDVVEMGGVDEFGYEYYYPGGNHGYLNLTWDHDPGTEIHTRSPHDPDMPDTMEFVYFKQTVEWNYNAVPLDVNITIDYGVIMTGDFYESEVMFRVYVWLIDSSGDWIKIHMSFPPYVHGHIGLHVISLSGFDIYDAWGGMIEDDAGHQEDPSDELIFAIGLAPPESWVHFSDIPWLTYDGSVTLMVTHFDAWVLLKETLPEERIQPLENKTWGSTDRNEQVMGIDVTPDGAIYTVGYDMPADDPYMGMSEETNLILVKWDSHANISWARSVGNDSGMTIGYAVAAHDNYVYTVGGLFRNVTSPTMEADTLLVKWQSNGIKLLERRYDFGNVDAAIGADNGPDGSLYVVYIVQETSPTYTADMYLGKFDSNLAQIWSVSINDPPYTFMHLVGATNDGHVYTATSNSLIKWDSNGNRIWFKNGTYRCMSVAPNGYVYAVQTKSMLMYPYEDREHRLVVWRTEKEPITNVSLAISYGGMWEEQIVLGALTTTADGNAYFWFYTSSSGGITHYLAKYDIYGNQIWNRTMSDDTYPIYYGFYPDLMDCDSNGRIYMASTSDAMDIRLLVYLDPSYSGWGFFNIPLGDVTSIALYGAAVILIVFVVVDFTRRRRAM